MIAVETAIYMNDVEINLQDDVLAISRIPIIANIFEVICRTTGMGFAAVARVTEDRWIACSVRDEISFGLQPSGELSLETTICNEIRQHHKPVVIDNVKEDAVFCSHHTPAMYGFQSYISMPIFKKDGSFFGTLCAIDPRPAKLNTPEIIGMFRLFADLIAFHLEAVEEMEASSVRLNAEMKLSDSRDQFIAILGHDLRNPINAIQMAAELLLQVSDDNSTKEIAGVIKNSSYRMSGLVSNILDFASSRLGNGLSVNLTRSRSIEKAVNQIVDEFKAIHPTRDIKTIYNITEEVTCDEDRIAQLLSNLLGNAITHGSKDTPVIVEVYSDKKNFKLSVSNKGVPISAEKLSSLFKPFFRGDDTSKGLGLGLYIASEIASAHNGSLTVSSTTDNTTFMLKLENRDF